MDAILGLTPDGVFATPSEEMAGLARTCQAEGISYLDEAVTRLRFPRLQKAGTMAILGRMSAPSDDEKVRELHKVYASTSAAESAEIYDGWSDTYETHMAGAGYAHPAMVAAMLTRFAPPTAAPVLDAGTGTGIMGQLLIALGYPNLSGFDASAGMLAQATSKSLYQDLRQALLGEPLPYADGAFAATVSSGVFTQGHAPLDGLDELIRVTQTDGPIVFSISRTYLGEAFETKARSLEQSGKWRRLGQSQHYDSAPLSDDVLTAQVFAFAVT